MNLHQLQPHTPRQKSQRVGRGGKRGTYSGKGMKGQKSRAGAGFKPGFRGGDNRIWQLFPKQRGASKRPGGDRPHAKHRFFRLRQAKPAILNVGDLNNLESGQLITPELLVAKGLIQDAVHGVKVLGGGKLNVKLDFKGLLLSESAKTQIKKLGGTIQ